MLDFIVATLAMKLDSKGTLSQRGDCSETSCSVLICDVFLLNNYYEFI